VTLHGYQNAGMRKLVANNCGLLAFDVGLGKTYTGIKTLARLRQEGRARRPVVLVPNTLVWKWARDFARCLPDYRVVVIGSDRREVLVDVVAPGQPRRQVRRWVARNDTPATRAEKWTAFQAGLYDVVLVTYSAFGRQQIDADFVSRYVNRTVALRRAITLALEEQDKDAEAEAASGRKKKSAPRRTERKEADLAERARAWVGEMLAPPKRWEYDPGIDWHQLGVDLLLVDEAQNFKNLFFSGREGASERAAAKRAWALDFRCASVREHAGGSGVILLSATPMKNAATEFYNLLHLVNPEVWAQVGVQDPESFINLFADIREMTVTGGDGKSVVRPLVVGFHHVDVLRAVVFRWATFKNAVEVGLRLPDVVRKQHIVQASAEQHAQFSELFSDLLDIEERLKKAYRATQGDKSGGKFRGVIESLKRKKQGIHARLYLTALHPGLVGGSRDPHAGPKLVEAAHTILKTHPSVCEVEPPPGERWVSRPALCDSASAAPEDACRTTVDRWCLTCGHIVFVENLDVHYWLRDLLVEGGVPAERIAILNAREAEDLELRQQLAEGFNGRGRPDSDDFEPPLYDVLIANAVAYEGVDLQTRTCQIHHLDVPWEAATLQQRNGRGVRQGARFPQIELHFYFVAGSTEGQRLEKIERKRGIMTSLYGEGDLATNTVVADVVEGGDVEAADAFLAFAPPHLRTALQAAATEERDRQANERDERARLAANVLLGDALQGWRRAMRAAERGDEQAGELRTAAQLAAKDLSSFPARLWSYPWLHAAQEAITAIEAQEGVDVYALPYGPALIAGARWQIHPGEGDAERNWVSIELTAFDPEGEWVRIAEEPRRSFTLRDGSHDASRLRWRPSWSSEAQAADAEALAQGVAPGPAHRLDGASWAHLGPSVQMAFWEKTWSLSRGVLFAPAQMTSPGTAIPMLGSAGLLLWGEPGAERLDDRVLPRTLEGWRRFLAAVRLEGRLKWTPLHQAARFWWHRDLPLGLLGSARKEQP